MLQHVRLIIDKSYFGYGPMASIIGFTKAKTKLSQLLDRVALGEEFIITRYDQRVARLIPEKKTSREEIKVAIKKLRELRKGMRVTTEEIVAWKNQSRR
jgi:prevent-host-death family protein